MDELLALLAAHRPDRAAEIRARLAGPAPDGVLVIGPDDRSVAAVASALAVRLPDRMLCAPADAEPRPSWVARTRAVVWVSDTGRPDTDRHRAVLGELAGAVHQVHLVLASAGADHRGDVAPRAEHAPAGHAPAEHALADAVPRLARHPVLRWDDGPRQLLGALGEPGPDGARRQAARLLGTALGELVATRETRLRHAEAHRMATEHALRRHRERLTAARLDAAAEWPRRVRAELAGVRIAMSAEAATGLRRLRDDVRDHLDHADPGTRAGFPGRLAAAVAGFTDQVGARVDELLAEVDRQVTARIGVGPTGAPHHPARSGGPVLAAAPRRGRWEDRLLVAVGVTGAVGLARFALTGGGAWPASFGAATVPLLVGVGVGVAYWLARARRAALERAALARWAGDALGDLRGSVDALLAERVLRAERRLGPLVDRVAATRVARLESELREHELLARERTAELAAHRTADAAELAALRAGRARLDRLLDGPGAAPGEVA